MLVGGADPHRHDLSHMTMLKDNHVWACANNRAADDGGAGGVDSTANAIPRAVQSAKAVVASQQRLKSNVVVSRKRTLPSKLARMLSCWITSLPTVCARLRSS